MYVYTMVDKKDINGIVLDCIIQNPFRKTGQLKEILTGKLSNGPISDALRDLQKAGAIRSEKQVENQRNNRWVAVEDNPLITIPQQVDRLGNYTLDFIASYCKKVQEHDKSSSRMSNEDQFKFMLLLPDALSLYIDYMVSFFVQAAFHLPQAISNEVTAMLLAVVLKKFGEIHVNVRKALEQFDLPYGRVLERMISKMLMPAGILLMKYEEFSKFGLGREIRPMLDINWQFGKPFRMQDDKVWSENYKIDPNDWLTLARKQKQYTKSIEEEFRVRQAKPSVKRKKS